MKNYVKILVSSVLVLLTISIIPLSIYTFGFVFNKVNKIESHDSSRVFKYFSMNSANRESSFGFVKLREEVIEGDSLFYNVGGDYHLISTVESDEYECTGMCFCSTISDRRNSQVKTITKSVFFLVGALSSYVAFERANEYFNNECHLLMEGSDECGDIGSIRSEVEDCTPIFHKSLSSSDEEEYYSDKERNEIDKKERQREIAEHKKDYDRQVREIYGAELKFKCFGKCMPYDVQKTKEFEEKATDKLRKLVAKGASLFAKKFGCEKYELSEVIQIMVPGDPRLLNQMGFKSHIDFASLKFVHEHLDPFCVKKSEVELHDIDVEDLNWCCGRDIEFDNYAAEGKGFVRSLNPSVSCYQLQ